MEWSWLDAQRGAWVWLSSSTKKVSRRYRDPMIIDEMQITRSTSFFDRISWNGLVCGYRRCICHSHQTSLKTMHENWKTLTMKKFHNWGFRYLLRMIYFGKTRFIYTVRYMYSKNTPPRVNNWFLVRIDEIFNFKNKNVKYFGQFFAQRFCCSNDFS